MKILKKNLQIAIDGPVASGKTTGAFLLAQKLDILYVYTGAMYRAAAYLGLQNGLDLENEKELIAPLYKSCLVLKKPKKKNRKCTVFLNGANVTEKLFSPRVSWGSSQVAVFPKVRQYLVRIQQKMAQNRAVVMEGRDIASIVLPKADLKIYMTASLQVRAKRRWRQMKIEGIEKTLEQVEKEVKKRDYNDSHRQADPLRLVPDAWVLNTSKMTVEQEVEAILDKLKKKKLID